MKFKLNTASSDSVLAIQEKIRKNFPDTELNFELETTDKVLHIHGVPDDHDYASRIESAIKESGYEGSWLTQGLENK